MSDVDRAKRFYEGLGWRLDADFATGDGLASGAVHASRLAVLDPLRQGNHDGRAGLGSGISISSSPTSRRHARELIGRGADVSEVFHFDRPSGRPPRRRAPTRTVAPTARSPRSAIPTATAGCCRRSRRGFPDEDSAASTSRR